MSMDTRVCICVVDMKLQDATGASAFRKSNTQSSKCKTPGSQLCQHTSEYSEGSPLDDSHPSLCIALYSCSSAIRSPIQLVAGRIWGFQACSQSAVCTATLPKISQVQNKDFNWVVCLVLQYFSMQCIRGCSDCKLILGSNLQIERF